MSDASSTWPKIRISPAIKTRIESLAARLRPRASLIELVDVILTQGLDIIETTSTSLTLNPQITAYRAQLGNKTLAEDSSDYGARLELLEKLVRDMQADHYSARVAEDPPTTRKRRNS